MQTPLQILLHGIGLSQYFSAFQESGYDDISFLRTKSSTDLSKILIDVVKMKTGHADKFMANLGKGKIEHTKKEKTHKDKTYIACVIDRSGSMQTMGNEVVNGFNTFVKEQQQAKKDSGEAYLSLVRFDDRVEVVHDCINLHDVPSATQETFAPRGMTALLDAVGSTINLTKKKAKKVGATKVIVVILTDGQENASKKWSRQALKRKICKMEDKHGWDFVFLAANQDAISVGRNFGMKQEKCITYGADREGMKCAMLSVAQNMHSVRSKKEKWQFTPTQRFATENSCLKAMPNLATK